MRKISIFQFNSSRIRAYYNTVSGWGKVGEGWHLNRTKQYEMEGDLSVFEMR